AVQGGGDVDPDAIGRVGGEAHRALDQVVARHRRTEVHPGRSVPALDLEGGDAVEAESHVRRRVDRGEVVILQRVDDDLVDRLRAAEVDLHPVRKGVGRGAVPAPAVTPVHAAAVAVVDRRYRKRIPGKDDG